MSKILAIYGIQDRYLHPYPAYVHDHNITLMENGVVQKYLHLERYTKRKYDNRLHLYIEELLEKHLQIDKDTELIHVNSFVGNSFISKTGKLRIEPLNAASISTEPQAAKAWFQPSKWAGFEAQSWVVSHELAHIFSNLPFWGDFKENSLLIHFDGGASLSNFSAFHFKNGQLNLLEYHWDLSDFSKIFNDNALSFCLMNALPSEHCSVPGKLMGYAAMGNPKEKLKIWLKNNAYFKNIWKDHKPFYKAAKKFDWQGNLEQNNDPFLIDVAASIQAIFEEALLSKIAYLQKQTQTDYLYYSGGCALNIIANSKIIAANYFKEVYIPPPCNDSGLSLGAAAFLNWYKGKNITLHHPYLNNIGIATSYTYTPELIKKTAQLIVDGAIIGICNGAGEAGPRALGNRSIIARADSKKIAQKVSMQCKGREWFRPVAPIMLARNAKRVSDQKEMHPLSKYMLLDFEILASYQYALAGVIHQNNTARIQSIFERGDNPFMYDLLDYLEKNHQQLALINTSFNKKGMPIVHNPQDAFNAAKEMNLDALIINGVLHQKRNHNELERHTTQRV